MKSIIKMVSLLAGYKKWVTLSLLLGAATIFANIGLLGTSTWLISRAALQPSIATLQVAIVGVRFFGISRGVLRYAERLISHSVNFRLVASLRKWFFERLEPLVPLALSENKAGDLLSRSVNDINALDTFFIRVISPLLVAIIVAAGMLIFTGSFAGGIIPILLIGYGVGGILVPFFQYTLMKKPTMRLTSERAHLDAALVDYQRGMAEILVNNRVDSWIHDFEKMQEVMNSSQKKLVFWVGAGTTAGLVTSNLTMLAVVYAFISLIASIDFGGILLCVLAVITLASFEAITPLNQTAKYLNANLTAGERLFQISEKNCMISEPLPDTVLPRRYDLEVESLTFSFPGSQETVLSKVGFTLRENHRLAILGPSGAGKTSLAQILMRLWDYQHGSIRLGGEEIKNLPAEFIRNRIGLLTQSPYIFTATIRGNLLLGDLKAKRIDLENVLEQTGLSTWVHGLEEGMDTWLGESGIKISGGEKQRLALARILLHKPAILILDEPTANLDSITAAGLVSAILAIRGCSQIWISHRSLGLETMNEILVLKSGVTIERGKPSELLRSSGWYRNLLDLEQKILPDAGTI